MAVLGVNLDSDEANARFAVETAQLNYPTLLGNPREGLAKQYRINACPTLVVLDVDGVVRRVHCGYSPSLREDLGHIVRDLLAKP